jgi:hypothetical protein
MKGFGDMDTYTSHVPSDLTQYRVVSIGTDHMPFAEQPSQDRTHWDATRKRVHRFTWSPKVGGLRKAWADQMVAPAA